MNWGILDKKQIVQKNGEDIIDLTSSTLTFDDTIPVVIDHFYVSDDMVMRPDLLSYLAYGNTDNFDLILKFNAISNPFSIDKEDYILIPDPRYMSEAITPSETPNIADQIRAQYIDESKQGSTNNQRLAYEDAIKELRKKTKNGNFSAASVPPNISQPGQTEATFNNGTITLG